MNVIKLNKDSVFKTKIEKSEEFENSFFSDCYSKAYKGLEDIIKNAPYPHAGLEENCYEAYQDDYNNIIAFLGERGSGKTSTMKSFALSLKEENQNNEFENNKDIFRKAYFDVLDVIDPSLFTHKESLVEIVVAEMFKCFKNDKKNNELLKKQQLVKQFEQVFQDIKTLNMDKQTIFKESNDNIETLIDLSSALSLKKDLKTLIDLYISYMNNCKVPYEKKRFLVIPIDDLDMNLSVGEKLLEDIRKYLIQANIIILMAVKFEQLQEIVTQKFVVGLRDNFSFYSQVYKNNGKSAHEPLVDLKNEIDDKTEKYLDKLIPYNRRCFMPVLWNNDTLEDNLIELDDYFSNIKLSGENGQESLWQLIKVNFYKKLNYIIISENHYRAIIPENLRSFIELMMVLNSMDNEKYEKNLDEVKAYYDEIIINYVNDREDILFLRDILHCHFEAIKKRALIYLNTKILAEIGEGEFDLNKIKDDLQYVDKSKILIAGERITLGDLITWIKIYETIESSNKKRRFIEIFKSVYTIRLLHAYHKELASMKENEKEIIDETIGKDLIGKYFYITNNHNKNKSYIKVELPGKSKLEERLSKIVKGRLEGKVDDAIIDDKLKEIINKIPVIIRPSFEKNSHHYLRLTRREKNTYNKISDMDRFNYFNLCPFNIVGDSILENKEHKIDLVINLDCFLSMLDSLDEDIENLHEKEEENIKKIIESFNKIYFNDNIIDLSYDEELDGYEQINLVNKESMKFIGDFIDDYLQNLKMKNETITNIENCQKIIERRLDYIISNKDEYATNTLRVTIVRLKTYIDKTGLAPYDVKLWTSKFNEYLRIFKSGSNIKAKDNNAIDFRNSLEELRQLLNQTKTELEG